MSLYENVYKSYDKTYQYLCVAGDKVESTISQLIFCRSQSRFYWKHSEVCLKTSRKKH